MDLVRLASRAPTPKPLDYVIEVVTRVASGPPAAGMRIVSQPAAAHFTARFAPLH